MLRKQFIFIILIVLCVGIFAEEAPSKDNDSKEETDDKLPSSQEKQPDDKSSPPSKKESSQPRAKQTNKDGSSSSKQGYKSNPKSPELNEPGETDTIQLQELTVSTTLVRDAECKADIQRSCTNNRPEIISNIKVLECIDNLEDAKNKISKECQNRIYKYKYGMLHDVRFDEAAKRFCARDIDFIMGCNDHIDERGTGRLVFCLYDQMDNITEPACRDYIIRLQSVIFTDWRLSESFASACFDDITKFKCGRLDDENETLPHEQGAVISCLSKNHNNLTSSCSRQISVITEMQSEDYHYDRTLYYACRDDRERLCPEVIGGRGRVYRCLYEQKFNSMMTPACRKEVHRRQQAVISRPSLDGPLIKACRSEMMEHKCVPDYKLSDSQISLVSLLLCLEERKKKGHDIKTECQSELLTHRRMLMSDYALLPELVSNCHNEMIEHCSSLYQKGGTAGGIDQRGGRMIHCLFNAARKERSFSLDCLNNVKLLLRAADPGENIQADPVLEVACQPVIDTLCAKIQPGHSNVVYCLIQNINNNRMTEECEDRLMDVMYFVARDWRLTPRLLSVCQTKLVTLCQLPQDWTVDKQTQLVPVGIYISCLYEQRQQLDNNCRSELQRLMHIRTQVVGLMPEIEDNCLADLATCKNPKVRGEEMKCLQEKYKLLEVSCKKAVQTFTQITMDDPSLDTVLVRSCDVAVQTFCPTVNTGNENDLFRCLAKYKNDQKMGFRCKASIEHHQITSLKDKVFVSQQFRSKCTEAIEEHCPKKRTKAAVIQCLANIMLQDVLERKFRLKEECLDELKFELLQRSESITSDPLLAKACKTDMLRLCAGKNPGNAEILDCLKANHNKVSAVCYGRLQIREKLDVIAPAIDYSLVTKCAAVIQKYCSNEKKANILSCLRRSISQDTVPNTCRQVLYQRLMIFNSDARFNKGLIENCNNDINKYCQNEVINKGNDADEDDDDDSADGDAITDKKDNEVNQEVEDRDMGGRVIGCLRSKYANSRNELDDKCVIELTDVIHSSKLDIKFDVKLYQKCRQFLGTSCLGIEKEDCLKIMYQQNKITDAACKEQVVRVIKEGRADIHVDTTLSFACQSDIYKHCRDVAIGNGKQLECLLKKSKSISVYCRSVLMRRQELWSGIAAVDGIDDLTRHIINSKNHTYLYTVLLIALIVIFLAGCLCRPFVRYRRVRKYNA